MDLWILSRLATAVSDSNTGFSGYDFQQATSACYNFWLYDLCDVYLECLKPVFQNGTDTAKAAARQTLFTCLDNGLRLISPFMPFISEELFQRLPRNDAVPSICVAAYPTTTSCPWKSDQVEREVEFIQKAAKIIRSARSDYNLPNKVKTEIVVVCNDAESHNVLQKYSNDLATTAYCLPIDFNAAPPASGCAILTITGQCEVHLVLKGLIEVDKELQKLEKKKNQLNNTVTSLNQAMQANDYAVKVPATVQQANSDKLQASESEIARIIAAMEALKAM